MESNQKDVLDASLNKTDVKSGGSVKGNKKGSVKQIIDRNYLLNALGEMLAANHLNIIVEKSKGVIEYLDSLNSEKLILDGKSEEPSVFSIGSLISQLRQISDSKTIERSKYYAKRLEKGLKEIRTGKINDLNLNMWKEYDDILTDSLWVFDRRDNSGNHNAGYWGNFIPQIPNQFIRRYTKKNEWVLDPFLGSGTTIMECLRLERNGVGIELSEKVANIARANIERDGSKTGSRAEILVGDSGNSHVVMDLKRRGIDSVQLIIMHPPYWDIIKFSDNSNDLSGAESVENFLQMFGNIVENTYDILDKGRYLVLVIGDKYANGEWIPLGFYAMNEVLKRGYSLKSIVVKNFNITRGKLVQEDLWRYRALVGGFYVFKHEYIFLFRKNVRNTRKNQ